MSLQPSSEDLSSGSPTQDLPDLVLSVEMVVELGRTGTIEGEKMRGKELVRLGVCVGWGGVGGGIDEICDVS